MSLREFFNSLNKEGAQGELIKAIFLSLIVSFLLIGILYITSLKNIPDFTSKYGFYLFFAILSYALILPSIRHIKAYGEFPCMTGMMIGMTIGMISGFLLGFYVGATNGMFWGSIFGMAIGIFFGAENGRCCGIMGVMEGIMAGFMGGLMGAMTAVMMFNDHLKAAGVIVFIISGVMMFGFNFMIYKETKGVDRRNEGSDFSTGMWSVLLTVLTIFMMVFGPRSVLLQ